MLASIHQFFSQLNRRDDTRISSAAADVPLHGPPNLSLAGMRSFFQQRNTRDDHARRAVATLHSVSLHKCFLHRMQAAIWRHALNGGDLLSSNAGRTGNARPHRRSVDEHSASSALALTASIFAAGEFQFVTQDPKQHA